MIRILVILGALALIAAAFALLRRPRTGEQSHSTAGSRPEAPASISLPGLPPFDVIAHLENRDGLPFMDFEALEQWAAQAPGAVEQRAALEAGRRAWLLQLRDQLGAETELLETADAWVLSAYPPGTARATARFMSSVRGRISRLLQDVARFPEGERSVFIALGERDAYYQYVANFYPEEGEFAFSGGMFINSGCPHFVAVQADLSQLEPVIAHELTHAALAHLSLPLWLDEGLAVNTEHHVSSSYRHPQTALETLGKHREFWTPEILQEFWSGQSFHRTDEGNELSYDLARAIVDLIGRDWPSFTRFATAASRDDGGAAAAQSELGLELGPLAAAALGLPPREDWNPQPSTWPGISLKAVRPQPCSDGAPSAR